MGVELGAPEVRPARASFVRSVLETIPTEDDDLQVARTHATLMARVRRSGSPRGAHDLIIAATAATRGRLVVCTDTSGFVDLPGVTLRG